LEKSEDDNIEIFIEKFIDSENMMCIIAGRVEKSWALCGTRDIE